MPGGTIPSQYRALKVLKCNNAACVRDCVSVPLIQISHHSLVIAMQIEANCKVTLKTP